jgi:hypothetical protein
LFFRSPDVPITRSSDGHPHPHLAFHPITPHSRPMSPQACNLSCPTPPHSRIIFMSFVVKRLFFRSPDHPIYSRALPPLIPIPDWRRLQWHHPNPSQFGVDFRGIPQIGVGLRNLCGTAALGCGCFANCQLPAVGSCTIASLYPAITRELVHMHRTCLLRPSA